MLKVKIVLPILLVIAIILTALSFKSKNTTVADSSGAVAFVNAQWGMSSDDVATANHASFSVPNTAKRFFSPKPGEEGRYTTLQASGQLFLGREADVFYTFKDHKLCMYHVFVSDSDEERLDKDMRNYLIRRWGGQGSAPQEDGSNLKLLWQFKDEIINYWLYQDELSLAGNFKAGVGVIYRPLTES